MKFQRGQAIVEFAILLPLFLILLFGIFYASMILADYMTLSSIARSSAREAAIISSENDYKNNYENIRKKYKDEKLPLDIFDWQATSTDNFNIKYDNNSHNVVVTMNAELYKSGSLSAY